MSYNFSMFSVMLDILIYSVHVMICGDFNDLVLVNIVYHGAH